MGEWQEFLNEVAETIRVERANPKNAEVIKRAWDYIKYSASEDCNGACDIKGDK